MNANLVQAILALVVLALPACIPSPPKGNGGSIAMIPFVDEKQGFRGNAPLEGWSEDAALIQQAVLGPEDELLAELTEQSDLVRLPRSTGTYAGAHLTWRLYSFATQLKQAPPGIYQVDMALAEMENGAGYYMVLLAARSSTYEANRAQYRAVLEHALYALEPL
jgi:hypothetical protein